MLFSGRSVHESKESHEYKTPNLALLIDRAKNQVRKSYKRTNPSRLELITLLEIVHDIVAKKNFPSSEREDSELRDICLGAWVFCFETIANEYRVLNPEHKEGYVYNSGSSLYKILLTQLQIDKKYKISEKDKLEYLNKFYNFAFKDKELLSDGETSITEEIQSKNLKIKLKEQLIQVMQNVLARETVAEKRVLRALPCESAIDYKMMKLYSDYTSSTESSNVERVFLTQLAVAICKNNTPTEPEEDLLYSFLSRSERVKMGTLIYIMQSITDSYKIRSPKGNSVLYDLCNKALLDSFNHLDNTTKLICLTAFLDYISDSKNRDNLEKYINKNLNDAKPTNGYIYIDSKILPIIKQIHSMIDKISPSATSLFQPSNVTLLMAGIGALIGSAPGYGTGYALGYGLSLMDQVSSRKDSLSNLTRSAMTIFFETGTYFGYYAADLMITATLERFFGKIFEAIGSLVCAAGAGGLSFVVYDVSYKTARNLCKLYFHLSKNMDSHILNQDDLEFINTLLDLPENVFSNNKKEKLRSIVDLSAKVSEMSFLSRASSTEILDSFDSDIEESAHLHSTL